MSRPDRTSGRRFRLRLWLRDRHCRAAARFPLPDNGDLANPLGRAIPAARISDCLLHPGKSYDFNGRKSTYPDIKLVYWAGGNPFHHHQDTNKLRAGFRRPETIIVHEPWWTATARHADIVLPATTTLERNDIGGAARDRFVVAMQQAIEPVGEARSDYAIFSALAHKLGCESEYTQGRDEMAWLRHIYDGWRDGIRTNQAAIPDFDQFWADGYLEIPQRAEEYVLLRRLPRRSGEAQAGDAVGAHRALLREDRRFRLRQLPTASDLDRAVGMARRRALDYPLHLISSQPRYRLHSQMDAGPVSARGKVAGREAVAINPHDAQKRGINDGDVVRVYNSRGACLAGAVVIDTMLPGVVKLSCGAWYDPAGTEDGAVCVHGNANVLTHDRGTSKLSQGPSSGTKMVEIERWTEPLPPVRAFEPPEVAWDFVRSV